MPRPTHIGAAIFAALAAHELTQEKIAAASGLSQSSISDLICRHSRPSPATLRAICHCWPTPISNLEILIGRLKDEIELAGHPIQSIALRTRGPDESDADLAYLESRLHMRGVAAAIAMIAQIVRDMESGAWRNGALASAAAEAPGNAYSTGKNISGAHQEKQKTAKNPSKNAKNGGEK